MNDSQDKLLIFVSSVQAELENERVTVRHLIQVDEFLNLHYEPLLYEEQPASPENATNECLQLISRCQVYVLIVGCEYGNLVGNLSITHMEYRCAKRRKLPILVFVKGENSIKRQDGVRILLKEIRSDGYKYKRFKNVIDLQKEVRAALVKLLQIRFGIVPTNNENEVAYQTIEATSPFEAQTIARLRWEDLDHDVARQLTSTASGLKRKQLTNKELLRDATLRGLVWYDAQSEQHYATVAGTLLLAPDPAAVFPQCRILADAYLGTKADSDPSDHKDIRDPLPEAIDQAIAFIDHNTRHPMRVVGLNRIRLDEYPTEALREAIVNAVAHRNYEDAGRRITLEVFFDRIVVSSPGLPPAPITLAKLRKGNYKPCSRNPVLAQCLSFFQRIEERGSGFRRMREQMLNHGLDLPTLGTNTGYFQVTFSGPGDNMDRLRTTIDASSILITPSIEAMLNKRQKRILRHVLKTDFVTSGWCVKNLDVVYDTANRDLRGLVKRQVLVRQGSGRSTRYVLSSRLAESSDNLPIN